MFSLCIVFSTIIACLYAVSLPNSSVMIRSSGLPPVKTLNETCTSSMECFPAFTECRNDTCLCVAGTSEQNGDCVPEEHTCAFGDPILSDSGEVINCQAQPIQKSMGHPFLPSRPPIHFMRSKRGVDETGCPDNFYCQAHGSNPLVKNDGHCCPLPKSTCPVGEPMVNATCDYYKALRDSEWRQCPSASHYCHNINLNGREMTSTCCPKPCKGNAIYRNGKCYLMSSIGGDCEIDDQCESNNGNCASNKCNCKPGFVLQNGACVKPYCNGLNAHGHNLSPILNSTTGMIEQCGGQTPCDEGEYCSGRFSVCCPIPAPFCPLSSVHKDAKLCNPTNVRSCGTGKFCFRFVNSAVVHPKKAGICCEQGLLPLQV